MEIVAGVGVELVRIGESRAVVESRIGPPTDPGRHQQTYYQTEPGMTVSYTADDLVELVQVGTAAGPALRT